MTTSEQSEFGRTPEPSRVAIGPATPGYPGLHPYDAPYGSPYGTPYGTPYGAALPPAVPRKPSLGKRALLGVGGAALAVGLVLAGVGIGNATTGTTSATAGSSISGSSTGTSGTGTSGTGGTGSGAFGGTAQGGTGTGTGTSGTGTSGTGTSGTTSAAVASATQQKGIVTVVSVLGYQNAESAGTGMILSSDGEVLTNNHVIDGATSVTVTVESTGKSYTADVVGTDPTDDVAVLQLRNASGLTTASVGDASDVADLATGDAVTGVGNANGTGTLTAAAGTVTALEQSITASDETGQNSENLTGLIETNAGIVAGDSGGPLYDSNGTIIGMDTAGSSGTTGTTTQAYAIPIDDALTIAAQIESGTQTTSVHIGLPAFMGIGVSATTTGGVGVSSVVASGPAADAGITVGSTITKVGGTTVSDSAALAKVLAGYEPGQTASITWTDSAGSSHTASVTFVSGPAD